MFFFCPAPFLASQESVDWVAAGEMGETWHQLTFFVPSTTHEDQLVVLEAVLGAEDYPDLGHTAIDDVVLYDGSCSAVIPGQ